MNTATLLPSPAEKTARDTGRLEAFSDGVIAIAITLLVLNLHTPDLGSNVTGSALWRALRTQWPSYDAFIISFAVIGIMWVNHHNLFRIIERSDHFLVLLNLALLFCIAVIPFPTALAAEYLGRRGESVATLVYTGWFFLTAIVYNRLWWYGSTGGRLLSAGADLHAVAKVTRRYNLGLIGYGTAFLLGFVSTNASLALTLLLALVFVLPSSSGGVSAIYHATKSPGAPGEASNS